MTDFAILCEVATKSFRKGTWLDMVNCKFHSEQAAVFALAMIEGSAFRPTACAHWQTAASWGLVSSPTSAVLGTRLQRRTWSPTQT